MATIDRMIVEGCTTATRERPAWPQASRPERDIDESDENRHLDERPDDTGQRLAGRGTEDADGDGDCELEVVATRR